MSVLTELVAELNAGTLKVVDLTQPLGPETPVIGLPPQFGSSPGVTMQVISRFDDKGPAWYWNTISMGEHTGTHFDAWEQAHGRIPAGAWVLLRSGWSKRTDPKRFLNVRDDGPHSPGFHKSTSQLLAKERDVLGVGVETVGTDAGQAGTFDPPFPNHATMHGAGKFGLASLMNLDQLPPAGAVVIAAPLKIVGGSGSPLRVLAITPG